ncbi:hypothetical protein RCL_jg23152.t1 [Rhizophagus clarus]|uniref:Myb-like domain-containing protein n=1 Tax=Rhizophagus clarus TaxID=94130 RepID=A0A8H3L6S3_9GLOM|nr:hypothetical protein RCL_jg23152.t1 [Rhizophagus clarus]
MNPPVICQKWIDINRNESRPSYYNKWTEEEDKILSLERKWKMIGDTMGKPYSRCGDRYESITSKSWANEKL